MIKKLYLKILHALVGLGYVLYTQSSFRILTIISAVLLGLNFLLQMEFIIWVMTALFIAFILIAEMFNTAIELLCDFIHPEKHPKIGIIKDITAGAVFLACIIFGIFYLTVLAQKLVLFLQR